MSESVIFSMGAVVFVATTAATLLFGYLRFNELREEKAAGEPEEAVSTRAGHAGESLL